MRAAVVAREIAQRLAPRVRATAERVKSGAGASLVGYAAFTLALFLVFLVSTFPHDAVLRSMIDRAQPAPLRIEVDEVALGWPLAYRMSELRVTIPGADPSAPLLVAHRLRATPSLLGLLRGTPYPLGLDAEFYGGSLAAEVNLRSDDSRLDVALTDVDLSRYAGFRSLMEGVLRGRLNAQITVRGDGRRASRVDGTLSVHGSSLALESGKVRGLAIPDLHFADVRVGGTIKSGRLEVTELTADGQELVVRGTGSIVLRTPVAASTLGLDLTVRPTTSAPDGMRLAVNLLPGSSDEGGTRTIHLGGTLGQPRTR